MRPNRVLIRNRTPVIRNSPRASSPGIVNTDGTRTGPGHASRYRCGAQMRRHSIFLSLVAGFVITSAVCRAQSAEQQVEIQRRGETIVLEPYAPKIVRVTLSLQHDAAVAGPGYGLVGAPEGSGWRKTETDQADVYQSARMVVTVEREHPPVEPMPASQTDIAKYFKEST